MNFILSKYLWAIFQPGNFLLILIIIGLVLYSFKKQKTAKTLYFLCSIVMIIISVIPISNWLIAPLENRFGKITINKEINGIIVLGGSEQVHLSNNEIQMSFNGNIDRLLQFVYLGRKYPNAKMIFSGGNGSVIKSNYSESDVAKRFFDFVGFDTNRIVFEDQSRNTYENALFSKQMIKPSNKENWILITSAISMPRAVGCFRNLEWEVIPFPVDYLLNHDKSNHSFNFNLANGLSNVNKAFYEWAGLLFYYALDRTSTFFPR